MNPKVEVTIINKRKNPDIRMCDMPPNSFGLISGGEILERYINTCVYRTPGGPCSQVISLHMLESGVVWNEPLPQDIYVRLVDLKKLYLEVEAECLEGEINA